MRVFRGPREHRQAWADRLNDVFRRERGSSRRRARAQEDGAQFADVARPVMERESLEGVWPKPAGLVEREAREEVGREGAEVLRAIPERRRADGEDGQAPVQVRAKASASDRLLELDVGGRDDADVDPSGALGPERADLARLEHTQEPRLHVERQLGDLVEEERAAVCLPWHASVDNTRAPLAAHARGSIWSHHNPLGSRQLRMLTISRLC